MILIQNKLVMIEVFDACDSFPTNSDIVKDKTKNTMLHYVEKPESYISSIINCGVYLFSISIFDQLATIFNNKQRDFYNGASNNDIEAKEAMWLEKDVLMPLAGSDQVMVYETTNWWSQIKTAGAAVYANRHYLKLYRQTNPERLSKHDENCNGNSSHTAPKEDIIGDVFIHPSANIHSTAVIGKKKPGNLRQLKSVGSSVTFLFQDLMSALVKTSLLELEPESKSPLS